MKNFLALAFLLFGLSAVNAQMMGNATPGYQYGFGMMGNITTPYNFTPYSYGYMPGFGMMGQGMMGGYGAGCPYSSMMSGYAPGFGMGQGMMGGYGGMMGPGMMSGYTPYSYGNAPESGMGSGMMGGMMSGYGYSPSFGIANPWMMGNYGYGSNSLLWIVITILAATVAYLLGKRSKA